MRENEHTITPKFFQKSIYVDKPFAILRVESDNIPQLTLNLD
jgi:hypothetical protein